MLPASRLRVYHLLQRRHLSFRSSSHMLLANKLRVYHSPKRRTWLYVNYTRNYILLKNTLLKVSVNVAPFFYSFSPPCLSSTIFDKKWGIWLTFFKRSVLFTLPNWDILSRMQPCVVFVYGYGATPRAGSSQIGT